MVAMTVRVSGTASVGRVSLKMRRSPRLSLPLNCTSVGPGPATKTGHWAARHWITTMFPAGRPGEALLLGAVEAGAAGGPAGGDGAPPAPGGGACWATPP